MREEGETKRRQHIKLTCCLPGGVKKNEDERERRVEFYILFGGESK
jgi:hypothetical protein